ncbi:Uncharacterised protein [Klebsiella aerogenes]|nr:Uncharacterised protein [Klebsiella aerogenes]
MKKAELLREALIAANTWCKANPELITVWVEKGSIETQATGETLVYVSLHHTGAGRGLSGAGG